MIHQHQTQQQGTSFLQSAFFLSSTLASLIIVYQFVIPRYNQDNKDNQEQKEMIHSGAQGNLTDHNNSQIDSRQIGNYTAYANGMAIDNNTGMMWSRCSIGQQWDGTTCTGQAQSYTWQGAVNTVAILNQQNYLGCNDWQLPHIEDLHSLIDCRVGFKEIVKIASKTGNVTEVESWCKGDNYPRPAINQQVFPNTQGDLRSFYWSSSEDAGNSNQAWVVNFGYGYDNHSNHADNGFLRVARSP